MYLNGTKCRSLLLLSLTSLSVFAKDAKLGAEGQGLRKPLCFVENKGQVVDQNNHPRADVQFKLSTPGMNLYIGSGQLHYQFNELNRKSAGAVKVRSYRTDVTLLGANPNATVVADDQQDYYENYLLSSTSDQAVTVHSWKKIIYQDIYPNIDWVIYIKDNQVEYDFNVRPGGDVKNIRLAYDGATSLKVTEDGNIAATTPMGSISEHKPFAYEQGSGKQVAANFRLNGNVVSFETGTCNGTLVIDPYLLWSTYFGGAGMDEATSVAHDAAGNTYVGGFTAGNGPLTAGTVHNTYQGGAFDAFVAKYNNAGALQFATYYGGPGVDSGNAIAVDITGNIYLAGSTTSNVGIASGGAYHGGNNGGTDGFLVKLNNNGTTRLWATYYGGTGRDAINGVVTDATNNVYVTGYTASATLVSTPGAYQAARSGNSDAFIAKFNGGGAIQWSTYYGGSANENGTAITCDPAGNVFVTGQTSSLTNMASAGAFQSTLSGTNDAYIASFSSGGTRSWGTYFGGPGTEQGNGIAYDGVTNQIAIVGNTTSATGLASAKVFQPNFGGMQDAFLAYFSPGGTQNWASYYGGPSFDYGQGVCFDLYGNIVVVGATFSTTGIASMNSLQPAIGGDYDAYIAKINVLGQTVWNTYFGGTFYDYADAVTCDAGGQLIVSGFTTSLGNYGAGGLSTVGSAQPANGGGVYDGFISKFKVDTFVILNRPFTDTLVCAGGNLNVSYTIFGTGVTFQPGNIFTVQLSNALGSFAAPVNIGSIASNVSGTVACTIPALTAPGTGYRIRIVGSNPNIVSADDKLDIQVVSSIPGTTVTSNSPTCVGGDIDLFDNAPYSVAGYSWSGPLGFSSALQNPVRTLATLGYAGVYSVTTTHNGCPPMTDTITVVVNDVIPPAPTASATSGCAGSTVMLFANPDTTATGLRYSWVGPGGFTSTMQNPTIPSATTANTGFYFVQDTLNGCPSVQSFVYVNVKPVLPVSLTISANLPYLPGQPGDTICGGTMVNFIASPTNGGSTPSYQWMIGATPVVGAITNIWSSSTLLDGETVYCILHSSVDCPSPANPLSNGIKMNVITNSPVVYIYATPGIHVNPGTNITFTSVVYNGGIAPNYQWYKNGSAITGATNATYTLTSVTKNDTISLHVQSTMACAMPDSNMSNSLVVGTNVGVANVSAALSDVNLFPNPNSGTFAVKGTVSNSVTGELLIEVSNLLGQTVYSGTATVTNGAINETIGIQDVPAGIYFLRLGRDGDSKVFRFAVQH